MRSIAIIRLGAVMATMLIFALAFAHVMELPGKLRLDGPAWLTVQQNLYVGFGVAGAMFEPLAIALSLVLVFLLRRRGLPVGLALLAAVFTLAGLIEWASVIAPMNARLNGWTVGSLPPEWRHTRDQWELGHVIHAALFAAALGALAGPALWGLGRIERRHRW